MLLIIARLAETGDTLPLQEVCPPIHELLQDFFDGVGGNSGSGYAGGGAMARGANDLPNYCTRGDEARKGFGDDFGDGWGDFEEGGEGLVEGLAHDDGFAAGARSHIVLLPMWS